jgi:hypothetical protein
VGLIGELVAAKTALDAFRHRGQEADRLAYNAACAAFAAEWKAAGLPPNSIPNAITGLDPGSPFLKAMNHQKKRKKTLTPPGIYMIALNHKASAVVV